MNVLLVTTHTLILCLSPKPVFSERMYHHPSCCSGRDLGVISSTSCSLSQYLIYQQILSVLSPSMPPIIQSTPPSCHPSPGGQLPYLKYCNSSLIGLPPATALLSYGFSLQLGGLPGTNWPWNSQPQHAASPHALSCCVPSFVLCTPTPVSFSSLCIPVTPWLGLCPSCHSRSSHS